MDHVFDRGAYSECISSYISNELVGSIEQQWRVGDGKYSIFSNILLKCTAL